MLKSAQRVEDRSEVGVRILADAGVDADGDLGRHRRPREHLGRLGDGEVADRDGEVPVRGRPPRAVGLAPPRGEDVVAGRHVEPDGPVGGGRRGRLGEGGGRRFPRPADARLPGQHRQERAEAQGVAAVADAVAGAPGQLEPERDPQGDRVAGREVGDGDLEGRGIDERRRERAAGSRVDHLTGREVAGRARPVRPEAEDDDVGREVRREPRRERAVDDAARDVDARHQRRARAASGRARRGRRRRRAHPRRRRRQRRGRHRWRRRGRGSSAAPSSVWPAPSWSSAPPPARSGPARCRMPPPSRRRRRQQRVGSPLHRRSPHAAPRPWRSSFRAAQRGAPDPDLCVADLRGARGRPRHRASASPSTPTSTGRRSGCATTAPAA